VSTLRSSCLRRHMEAVVAAETLLLGKRALRRRPKEFDSVVASSAVSQVIHCMRFTPVDGDVL
jgi:hypothetical protein